MALVYSCHPPPPPPSQKYEEKLLFWCISDAFWVYKGTSAIKRFAEYLIIQTTNLDLQKVLVLLIVWNWLQVLWNLWIVDAIINVDEDINVKMIGRSLFFRKFWNQYN